jgi:23S rRNA pseudouridine1911/1915/1917 synthase
MFKEERIPDDIDSPEVVFEDEQILVVNKPAGLSTQAPRVIDSLELRVRAYLQKIVNADLKAWHGETDDEAPPVYLGLPHRLDRPVSGVIVFAKTKKAARRISRQFELRRVEKLYWAVVSGRVAPADGTWENHLMKVPDEAHVNVVDASNPLGQRSVLHYKTLSADEHSSLLEIDTETGRMHQIRVQAASRGWPIFGDVQYGSQIAFGKQFVDARLRAIGLHARQISFEHPTTKERVTYNAPVPASWRELGINFVA